MADRVDERLRELFEELGYSAAEATAMVVGRDGPRDPAAAGRELFTEAQATRFAQEVGGVASGRGSVLTALAEAFGRPPFGLSATEATGWAKARIVAVAEGYPGRPDLAEAECWRIVGALRAAAAATAGWPSTGAPSGTPAPPRTSSSSRRGLREVVTEWGTVLPSRRG